MIWGESQAEYFPSFSEGLSLRDFTNDELSLLIPEFPFLFGGTFIEGIGTGRSSRTLLRFPFLFGGTFIEGILTTALAFFNTDISLPFRRDFH